MGEISAEQFMGFLVPDHRFVFGAVAAKGTGATDSDYTQAGAQPGVPAADDTTELVLVATGDQSEDGHLEVYTQRAGNPGQGAGSFLWRDVAGGDGTDDYYGQDGYQLVTGWESLYHTTTSSQPDSHLDALRLTSGKVLVVGVTSTSGLSTHSLRRYDPAGSSGAGAWSSLSLSQADWQDQEGPGLCQITEGRYAGRVLLFLASGDGKQIDVYYSDDEGTAWALAGTRVLDSEPSTAIRQIRAVYLGGSILLLVQHQTGGSSTVEQYASSDLGGRFSAVTTSWGSRDPEIVDAAALPGGGALIAVQDITGGRTYVYRASSAWEPVTDVEVEDLGASTAPGSNCGLSLWMDEDGLAWLLALDANRQVRCWRSTDNGDEWTEANGELWDEGSTDYPYRFACASTGGRGLWAVRWVAATLTLDPMSVGCAYLGGHSQLTAPRSSTSNGAAFDDYVSFGTQGSSSDPGALYLPIQLPGSLSTWTATGTGSESITSSLECEIDTTAQNRYYTASGNDDDVQAVFAEFAVEVDSGDGDAATKAIAFLVRVSDYSGSGSSNYELEATVRIDHAGYQVWDENGGQIGSEQALDFTSVKHIRVALDKDQGLRVWYSTGGQDRNWTLSHSSTTVTDAGAGTNGWMARWGHLGNSTSTTRWSMVGVCFWAGRWGPTSEALCGTEWTNPDDLRGRDWPTRPALLTDGVRVEARSGPSYTGETWQIEADYTHPLSAAFPEVEASPRKPYRSSSDGADAEIVLDLDPTASEVLMDSTTIALAVFGANVSSVQLQGHDGTSWTTLATASATSGWGSLGYARKGPTIQVDTGVSQSGPYLNHTAHVGDTIDLGSSKLRRVGQNTSGAWTDTATKRPTIQLDAALYDDTEPANGTATIWRKDFAVVLHEHTTAYEKYRLRIPSHSTADGYYEIGSWYLGPVEVCGAPADFDLTERRVIPQSLVRRRAGGARARSLGPVRREFEIGWGQNVVDPWRALTASPAPDYIVGSAGGAPIATPSDTVRVLEGLRERLKGAETPVVFFQALQQVSGTTSEQLTDSRYFAAVRLETDTTREIGVGDRWGVDEMERLDRLTLTEVV